MSLILSSLSNQNNEILTHICSTLLSLPLHLSFVPTLWCFSKQDQELMIYGHLSLSGTLILVSHTKPPKLLEINAFKATSSNPG